jgi:hypothetical protein
MRSSREDRTRHSCPRVRLDDSLIPGLIHVRVRTSTRVASRPRAGTKTNTASPEQLSGKMKQCLLPCYGWSGAHSSLCGRCRVRTNVGRAGGFNRLPPAGSAIRRQEPQMVRHDVKGASALCASASTPARVVSNEPVTNRKCRSPGLSVTATSGPAAHKRAHQATIMSCLLGFRRKHMCPRCAPPGLMPRCAPGQGLVMG